MSENNIDRYAHHYKPWDVLWKKLDRIIRLLEEIVVLLKEKEDKKLND